MLPTDEQVRDLDRYQLAALVAHLRDHIRWHMRLEGNDRCWQNDVELYNRTLPEGNQSPIKEPQNDLEFIGNCIEYRRTHKRNN